MKPIILTFARYYLPGYRAGGPVRTIANMVEQLGDVFDFRIVASNCDLGGGEYQGIEPNTWVPCGKALVRYVQPGCLSVRELVEIVLSTRHDVIYLNSFFDVRFSQQILMCNWLGRLRGKPVVVAPRGEFSRGALRIKSRRKRTMIMLGRVFGLYGGVTWQASSLYEADDIRRTLDHVSRFARKDKFHARVVIAPDMVNLEFAENVSVKDGREIRRKQCLRVCFLSRISPMKNLEFALRVLADVHTPVDFSIYGPIEDRVYWDNCCKVIHELPSYIRVIHHGEVDNAKVVEILAQHDLFFFPTRGENFGHVIHEALRAGLPLLISDQTPWKQLESQGVGWDLPLSEPSAFAARIEWMAGLPDEERKLMASKARSMAMVVGNNPEVVEANERLFMEIIDEAAPYEC